MALEREKIAKAIEDRLRDYLDVPTVTRSPTVFVRASSSARPTVLFLMGAGRAERNRGVPPKWTIAAEVHVRVRNDSTAGDPPDVRLNEIEDAIERAFCQQTGEVTPDAWLTSLGGLVTWCRVVGSERSEGEAQQEGTLTVDLEILAVGA